MLYINMYVLPTNVNMAVNLYICTVDVIFISNNVVW